MILKDRILRLDPKRASSWCLSMWSDRDHTKTLRALCQSGSQWILTRSQRWCALPRPPAGMYLGSGRKPGNPEETHTHSKRRSGSKTGNLQPWQDNAIYLFIYIRYNFNHDTSHLFFLINTLFFTQPPTFINKRNKKKHKKNNEKKVKTNKTKINNKTSINMTNLIILENRQTNKQILH